MRGVLVEQIGFENVCRDLARDIDLAGGAARLATCAELAVPCTAPRRICVDVAGTLLDVRAEIQVVCVCR